MTVPRAALGGRSGPCQNRSISAAAVASWRAYRSGCAEFCTVSAATPAGLLCKFGMSGSRGFPGEIAGARAFGGAQMDRDLGQPLGQVRVQLRGQLRSVAGALRVEDDDDPVEGRHGVVVLGHMRR